MSKHTPGPYSVHPYTEIQGPHEHDGGVVSQAITIGAGKKMLGEVRMRTDSEGYPQIDNEAEMRATAALWIAAPDMLVALQWIDGEAPAKKPSGKPTVGYTGTRDPEEDYGDETIDDAFREGVAYGLWLAAEQARTAIARAESTPC